MGFLAERFLAASPEQDATQSTVALEEKLVRLVETARLEYPGFDLSEEDFVVHLAHLHGRASAAPEFDELRAADVMLACACLQRCPRALAHLDAILSESRSEEIDPVSGF